jgi:FtsP/CotA-like multicopper oxidase with cupredoxin domain
MHLHGYHFEVVAQDGFVLGRQNRFMADTLMIAPGQRFDVIVHADYPGVGLPRPSSRTSRSAGMYGMVTALVVQ